MTQSCQSTPLQQEAVGQKAVLANKDSTTSDLLPESKPDFQEAPYFVQVPESAPVACGVGSDFDKAPAPGEQLGREPVRSEAVTGHLNVLADYVVPALDARPSGPSAAEQALLSQRDARGHQSAPADPESLNSQMGPPGPPGVMQLPGQDVRLKPTASREMSMKPAYEVAHRGGSDLDKAPAPGEQLGREPVCSEAVTGHPNVLEDYAVPALDARPAGPSAAEPALLSQRDARGHQSAPADPKSLNSQMGPPEPPGVMQLPGQDVRLKPTASREMSMKPAYDVAHGGVSDNVTESLTPQPSSGKSPTKLADPHSNIYIVRPDLLQQLLLEMKKHMCL
jgi:hypothetical protein